MWISRGGPTSDSIGQYVVSSGKAQILWLRCYDELICEVRCKPEESWIQNMFCAPGTGREDHSFADLKNSSYSNKRIGCHPCSNSKTRLMENVNGQCEPCPKQAEVCLPTELKMPIGMTIDPKHIATGVYCPAKLKGTTKTNDHLFRVQVAPVGHDRS